MSRVGDIFDDLLAAVAVQLAIKDLLRCPVVLVGCKSLHSRVKYPFFELTEGSGKTVSLMIK